jgi:ATP-binding cassette subfamily F protein 3
VDDRTGPRRERRGKSTFAKMVAGVRPAIRPTEKRWSRVGWFHQHQIEALDPADTPLDIIRRARLTTATFAGRGSRSD